MARNSRASFLVHQRFSIIAGTLRVSYIFLNFSTQFHSPTPFVSNDIAIRLASVNVQRNSLLIASPRV